MLDHWYFTRCIHGTPDASAAFLSILDVLRRADDERLVGTALEELGQAEALMQVYAVGPVVEAARRCESDAVRHLATARVAAVLDHVPESADHLAKLADAAIWQSPSADIIELAEEAAKAVLQRAREPGESQPYLDLQERVAETTLLSLVWILHRAHRELDRMLSPRGDEEAGSTSLQALVAVLENASAGAYGRLAQLLAVRVLATSQEPRALLVRVRRTPGTELDVEPDILTLAAELSLVPATRKLSDEDRLSALEAIRAEATELRHLRRLLNETPESRGRRDSSRPLADMGLTRNPDRRLALTGVLWHAALWQIAARLDPKSCSGWLAATWRETPGTLARNQPDGAMTRRSVGQRRGDRDREGWLNLLRSFLAVRQDSKIELRYSPDYDKISEYFESTLLPHLFSPWLVMSFDRRRGDDYPSAREPLAMLRLLLAASLGVELLESTGPGCPGRDAILRTVAHAARVLGRFSGWLRNYASPDELRPTDLKLPPPVTSLALFARSQVADVGCGLSAQVDPAEFADLLGNDPHPTVARRVLAWTLAGWIADGLAHAHDHDLAGRWLPLAPDVCWVYAEPGPRAERMLAALIMRYAVPGGRPDLSSLQWHAPAPGKADGQEGMGIERVSGRQLLLSSPSPRPWQDWELTADMSSWSWTKRVILAIQRVGDLPDSGEEPDVPTREWVDDLRSMLRSANVVKELDRFARLRLIELLDAPAVTADYDVQLLIMRVIIEFGTPYDWSRLFDRVLVQPGASQALPHVTQRLRLDYGRLLARGLEYRGHADLDRGQLQNPRSVDRDRRRLELIRDQLSVYLYDVSEVPDPEQAARVRQEISRLRTRRVSLAGSAMERVRATPDILGDGRPVLSVPAGQAFFPTWTLRAVLRNPVDEVHDVHFQAYATWGETFLFDQRGMSELRTAGNPDAAGATCIGFVLAEAAGAEPRYQVNFGTGSPVTVPASRGSAFSPGDAVTVELTRDPRTGTVSATGVLRPLALRENAGGPTVAEVTEQPSSGNVISVAVHGRRVNPKTVDLNAWDPDISRSFASLPSRTLEVGASSLAGGSLMPLPEDLPGLLAREEDVAREPLVLTFCGYDRYGLGNAVWRFSSVPGITYDLAPAVFEAADADALDAELRCHDDPRGLLVAVQAARPGDRVRLRLVRSAVSDPLHPGLRTPFDLRNLWWRDRFTSDDSQIATRDSDGNWTITTAAADSPAFPGFPDRLHIRWQGRPPARTEQRTEVTITSWDPRDQRQATARAQAMQVHSLNWQDDPAGVLDRMLGLAKGSLLTLGSAVQTASDAAGNVRCRTADGLLVAVAVESLTMARTDDASSLDSLTAGRVAEVTSNSPWGAPKAASVRRETLPDVIWDLGTVDGILIQVPRPSEENATSCHILFRVAGETRDAWIDLTDLPEVRPVFAGDKITVTTDPYGGAQALISNSRVFARALWSLRTAMTPVEGARYLGEVKLRGQSRPLCQSPEPGVLLLWPEPVGGAGHLAKWSADAFRDGLPDTWMAWNESSRFASRVKLRGDGDQPWYLCGWTSSGGGTGRSEVRGAPSLRILPRGDNYALDREFWIRTRAAQARTPDGPVGGIDREAMLERLARLPAVQVTVPEQTPARVLLPELMAEGLTRAASHVAVAPDSHPHVADAPYGRDGRGRLHREDGGFVVTFEDVPPLSPEQYREHLGASLEEDVRAESLCYVGPRVIGENGGERPGHLFEFGYGWTLLVPEERLQFRGQPFKAARFLLFHGDRVTHIRFLEQQAGAAPTLVIDVSGVLIRSQGTSLYLQAKEHGLVHTVNARVRDDRLQVDSIEGFDEERLRDWASYRPSRVRIHPDSVQMLIARSDGPDERLTFYARLDTGLFEETIGQVLLFRHVKLTLDPDEGDAALRDREVVFLRGGSLRTTRNDALLRLHALRGFDPSDVGRDIGSSVNLRRRQFSVQENLLRRAAAAGKVDSYEDTIFAVRLTLNDRGAIEANLRTVPPRPLKALRDVLKSTGDVQYAAVDAKSAADPDNAAPGTLRVEVRPGVIFELPEDRIVAVPPNLDEGAIVRLDFEDQTERFVVMPCTYSTRRYVGEQGRPVVALPMNGLLRHSLLRDEQAVDTDRWWTKSKSAALFTVGGLPAVVARPAAYQHDESRWLPPRARALRGLMARPHPKVAWLGWQQPRGWFLAPNLGAAIYGTLQVDAHRVALRRLNGDAGQVMRWHRLSFMDAGIDAILARARQRSWRYHDRVTGWWRDDEVVEEALLTQTLDGSPGPAGQPATAGLLFFAPDQAGPRLRYSGTELPYYGFPVSHLVESTAPASEPYAVAGVSRDGDRPAGLWLELVPGQVVEIMGELMTWSSGGSSLSLGQLAWQHFAPGDEIILQATPQELSTVDKIELRGWRRGPRAAFGPRRALLPVAGHDRAKGSLRLGAGTFTLDYPTAEPTAARAAWLTSDNELTPDDDATLRRGDTVLIGCDPRGRLVVLGAERYEAKPDRKRSQVWDSDPLREALLGRDGNGPRPDLLRYLITAAGGAVPATVEGVFEAPQGMVAFFSFRHQRADLEPGQLAIAQPLGLLGDRNLLLRLGRGLIRLPMRNVVSGAPPEAFSALAVALAESSTWIWVHREASGEIRTGLSTRRPRNGHFQAELAIGPEDGGTGPIGLLARSVDTQRLYWCPADHLAHAQLSLPEIKALWITSQPLHMRRPFRAALIGESRSDRHLSIVRGSEAMAEVKRLHPGAQLRVTVRARPAEQDAGDVYLVESYATKITMRCRVRAGMAVRLGDLLHVEVDEHRPAVPRMITVVPVGERRYRPDLPAWMLGGLPEPKQRRAAFSDFLRWRVEAGEQAPDAAELAKPADGPDLRRLLCHAYQASLANGASPAVARVALRWLRAEDELAEIDLPYPLMALAILATACRQGQQPLMEQAEALDEAEAAGLLRTFRKEHRTGMVRLARRAVRSIHVEALIRRWIQGRPGDSGQIWQRISRLEGKLAPALTDADISEILQFAHAAELAGDWEGLRIADGLKAAIGQLEGIERICDDASILMKTVALCRMQVPDFTASRLPGNGFSAAEFQLDHLRQIIEQITLDAIDITLLPAISSFDFARDRRPRE